MDTNKNDIRPENGLKVPGPLTGGLSSIRVGVKPPDIPLIDRIRGLIERLEEKGGYMPPGSSISVRTIDGFVHIKDLSDDHHDPEKDLRVIEYDPVRNVFLVGGEGDADIMSEISWYALKAVPEIIAVLFIPEKQDKITLPRNSRERMDAMLGIADLVKKERMVLAFGSTILGLRRIEDIPDLDLLFADDQSKSQ